MKISTRNATDGNEIGYKMLQMVMEKMGYYATIGNELSLQIDKIRSIIL